MALMTDVATRLVVATLIGSLVGLDRELRHKPAGLKTHALVGLGAALVIVVASRMSDPAAMSRAIQGILAGVGFLGGGAILKSSGEVVFGLTTAASIWVVASLGIACGAGQWLAAVVAMVIALIVLVFFNALEGWLRNRHINGTSDLPRPSDSGPGSP